MLYGLNVHAQTASFLLDFIKFKILTYMWSPNLKLSTFVLYCDSNELPIILPPAR